MRLRAAVLAIGLTLTVTACGSRSGPSDHAYRIDERAGEVDGIHIDGTPRQVLDRYGRPPSGPNGGWPTAHDPEDAAGSDGIRLRPHRHPGALVYSEMAMDFDWVGYPGAGRVDPPDSIAAARRDPRARIIDMEVTAPGSRTRAGVHIGSAMAAVQRAYPALRCGTAGGGEDPTTWPYCVVRIAPHRYLGFGFGDGRVHSITLSATPILFTRS